MGFNSGFKGLMQGTMNIKCYLFFKKRNSIISAEFLFVRDNFKTATAVSMISTRLPHKSWLWFDCAKSCKSFTSCLTIPNSVCDSRFIFTKQLLTLWRNSHGSQCGSHVTGKHDAAILATVNTNITRDRLVSLKKRTLIFCVKHRKRK